jgi:hypothetical protein
MSYRFGIFADETKSLSDLKNESDFLGLEGLTELRNK